MELRPQLSLLEQLAHAIRLRSPGGAATAISGATISRLHPKWWREKAPWYVGRLVEVLGLRIRVDGGEFTVPSGPNETLLKGLLWLERYETLERHAIRKWLPRDVPVVELGASMGVVSCLVNRSLVDPVRHVCVEANPDVVPVLRRNRDANHCRFNIVHAALAYGSEFVDFGVSDAIVDSSVDGRGANRRVLVPSVRLGQVIRDAVFERCSLICDIEGAEGALMAHESDVLRDSVDTVIIEVHPGHLGSQGVANLYEQFVQIGFAARWQRGDVWVLSKNGRAK